MSYLALDLSKTNTGWAQWAQGWEKPIYGSFSLGSEFTTVGQACAKLHRELAGIHAVTPVEWAWIEEPIAANDLRGHTNKDTLFILSALAAHAHSFAYAKGWAGKRVIEVNVSSWRKHFLGSQKRGTKRATWKMLADERCRQFGWKPKRDDEADALGILDYALYTRSIQPPWRTAEVLRPMSEIRR